MKDWEKEANVADAIAFVISVVGLLYLLVMAAS